MRTLPISEYPKEHFPQIKTSPENQPKNYVVINHTEDETYKLSKPEIVEYARKNSATALINNEEYFVLVFGSTGNKPVLLLENEIEKAINDSSYGQCPKTKMDCTRIHLCHIGAECQRL